MKKLLLFLLIFTYTISAQTDIEKEDAHLKEKVNGIVINGNSYYLVTDNGFIQVEHLDNPNDQWDAYYKMVYGDDVENPNTIIQPRARGFWPFRFFRPYIPLNDWIDDRWGFSGNMFLYNFIRLDMDGNYEFRPGVMGIIADADRTPDVNLPELN